MDDNGQPVIALAVGEVAPEEIEAMEREAEQQRARMMERLDALGISLATTRAEAINARRQSGIEEEWAEDEEFYQGIDDANRHETRSAWRTKPPGQETPKSRVGDGATQSTVFPNITGPYCDAAAARIADMLLPTDDRAWAINPTPAPDLVSISEGKIPPDMIQQAAQSNPGNPEMAKTQLAQAVDEAARVIAQARERADKAQTRIEDWHVECQFHAQVRQVIEDAARIGTGVLKGPIPMRKVRRAWQNGQIVTDAKIVPGSRWISPWDFFPDAACGENIHNGSYTWERDNLTRKQLRDLMEQEGYIPEQIAACLEEGAHQAIATFKPVQELPPTAIKDRFEVWYYHGTLEKKDIEAAGVDCCDLDDPHVPAIVVMVNNRVIKAALNPLDTGEFPYDVMIWRRRMGHWTGIGVARQIRTPQRMAVAATRNLMDNAGIAGGPMLVFRKGVVQPANKVAAIAPRKIWYIAEDADEMVDATKAIGTVKVDMVVNELMQIIQLGLKLAEDVTGLPMLLQGQQGKAPDTVGGMQMLNNNASAVLRRLARLFDDRITEPHVRRYYSFLLEYGDDAEKGDFSIDARGSSALVERDIQNQELAQMAGIVTNPVFGKDPKKWIDEYLRSRHLDPKRFDYEDQEWQQIVENMKQGPQDPRVALAQFNAQVQERFKQMDQAFEASENQKDRELDMILADMDTTLGRDELTAAERKVLTDWKGRLGETVLKLRAQSRMQERDHAVQVTQPPVEPDGRAQPGKAFLQ